MNHVIKCCLTIHSGLLNSNKIVPVASLRGLTLQIELEQGSVCLESAFLRSDSLEQGVALDICANILNIVNQEGDAHGGGGGDTNVTELIMGHDSDAHSYCPWTTIAKSGGDGTRTSNGAGWNEAQAVSELITKGPLNSGDNVRVVGSITEAGQADIPVDLNTTIASLGVVANRAWGGGANRYELQITIADQVTIPIGAGGGLRKTLNVTLHQRLDNYSVPYTIMNPVFNLKKVLPPAEYAQELDAMEQNNELEFEITTYTDYPNNLPHTTHTTQQIIATNTRALSLISIDQQIVNPAPELDNNLTTGAVLLHPFYGNIQSYQLMIDQVLVPNRAVDTTAEQPQKAINELNKALVNIGEKVNSLGKIKRNWAICRAFTNYNGTFNLYGTNLQLTKKYPNAPLNVITHNFVGHLRSIVMGSNGVQVVL